MTHRFPARLGRRIPREPVRIDTYAAPPPLGVAVKTLAIAIAGIALASIAGCSGSASSSSQGSGARSGLTQPTTAPELLLNSRGALRLEAQVSNSVQLLTARCMRAQHLLFYPELDTVTAGEYRSRSLPEFPPYTNLASRRSDGYGLYASFLRDQHSSGSPGADDGTSRETRYVLGLSSAQASRYDSVLKGASSDQIPLSFPDGVRGSIRAGGCEGRAEASVYGSVRNYAEAFTGLSMVQIDYVDHVESSGQFQALSETWSRCMQARGFSYSSPMAANDKIAAQYARHGPEQAVRRHEIAVAVADYQCASKVSLASRTYALQQALVTSMPAALERDLLHYTLIYNCAGHLRKARCR